MGDASSGDGGNDDPHRAWRRPAPGEAEPTASKASFGGPGGDANDPQRAIWGPGADVGRQPHVEPFAGTPPTWQPPSAAAPGAPAPASTGQRWEPVVGAPATADPWGGWSGPPGAHDVGVDERPAPPPRRRADERLAGWWARGGIVAAVLAAVLIVVAVASGSDSGGDVSTATSTPATSAAPPTTVRRVSTTTTEPATSTTEAPAGTDSGPGAADPADLPLEDDPRVVLTDLPDGFTATGARVMRDVTTGGITADPLFVADASTWSAGPWIRITPAREAAFVGPVAPVDAGGRPARLGTSELGAELVVVDVDDAVAVAAKGLPPGTATTLAAALLIGPDGVWSLPGTALPPGMRMASGDLADSLGTRSGRAAFANYQGPRGVGLSVYATIADPSYDPLAVAPFYLSDVSYVTIGSERGVMGRFPFEAGSDALSIQWRHGHVDIEVTAYGIPAAELLQIAAHASTRADGGWSERDWDAAAEADGGESPETVQIEQTLAFGEEGSGTAMVRPYGSMLSWWVDTSTEYGIGRYGQVATTPVMLQVAANGVPAIDTGGITHVVALVLGDASIDGATLRLRSGSAVDGGGATGHDSGNIVHALNAPADDDAVGAPSELGYTLGAAVSVPWTDGTFVAELIAADGVTILATATPADLR